jgi:hypothetical protein
MVKTRTQLKVRLKEWVSEIKKPFSTNECKNEMDKVNTNIFLSPNRLVKYIKPLAVFDKKLKKWKPKN